jgi:hypothetical protein
MKKGIIKNFIALIALVLMSAVLNNCASQSYDVNVYPNLNVPGSADFGNVKIGESKTITINMYTDKYDIDDFFSGSSSKYENYIECDLTIRGASIDDSTNFSLDASDLRDKIGFGKSTAFNVVFHPQSAGAFEVKIAVKYKGNYKQYDDERQEIIIKGTGIN